MTDVFDNMIMHLFVIRIGKVKTQVWRVAYGLLVPCIEKMDKPYISESTSLCSCSFGADSQKIFIKRIIYASEREIVQGIFEDISSGKSLKDSFKIRGLNTDMFNFDVRYSLQGTEYPYGIEDILDSQLTYIKSVSVLEPEQLLEKDGKLPDNIDNTITVIEDFLQKKTKLPFGEKFDHMGNMDIIIELDRDPKGKSLVELQWKKSPPAYQHIKVCKELLANTSKVMVNVRFADDRRVLGDRIQYKEVEGEDLSFDFEADKGTSYIETKVWIYHSSEYYLIHHAKNYLLTNISVTLNAVGDRLSVTSDWLNNIREQLPNKKADELKEAMCIERSSKEHFVVGEKTERRRRRKSLVKTNDEFFPKGWDAETDTQGMLSFLRWFKQKTNGASGVFLQDPYFDDIAMYFIGSADTNCEYTILTQTRLKTNPDGTANMGVVKSGEDSKRRNKIVNVIKINPLLFMPMKLVIKDIPITNNVLHDRYMIFDYGNDHIEAYMLSNSLQGATKKHPLLVTQIGDLAFEKIRKHIDETIDRASVETIYDYRDKKCEDGTVEKNKLQPIADKGFYDWLVKQKEIMLSGNVADILSDICKWNTNEKMATFGFFLAKIYDEEADVILKGIADLMAADTECIRILKDFILTTHYSIYPIGYIEAPYRGSIYMDYTRFLEMNYKDIVTNLNTYCIDYLSEERNSFGVYGQYFAAKLLIKVSPDDALDVLKKLRPMLLNIKEDRTISPVFKVTQMLLSEMMKAVIWHEDSKVMQIMLNDTEAWCKGIGALMLLHKAKLDEFNVEEYKSFIKEDDEIATLCLAAWEMDIESKNKEIFYKLLRDLITRKAEKIFFKDILSKVLESFSLAKKKADFIEKVALPLISQGFTNEDDLTDFIVDKLYNTCIEGSHVYIMRESLIMCIKITRGNTNSLIVKGQKTLENFEKDIAAIPVKNDYNIFHAAEAVIQLRQLLLLFIREYHKTNMKDKVMCLLGKVDKSLDDHGLKKTKKIFEL